MLVSIGSARVELGDWAAVETAAREGLINERTHCELKRGLPPSSQNIEIARDIASMTVEGGVILYGVEDAGAGRAGAVVGIRDAEAAKSRLIAIAQGSVQPSVMCDVRVIPHPDDPDIGCVLVMIPPSPVAPHRADERYWGRSAEGKRVLSDADVAALFAARRNRVDDFRETLIGLDQDFDPVPPTGRTNGHLYYCARPLQMPTTAAEWDRQENVLQNVVAARAFDGGWGGASLMSLNFAEAHPAGIMANSLSPDDNQIAEENRAVRLLLRDDGGVDLASGIATRERPLQEGGAQTVVLTAATLTQLDQAVRVTAHLGRRIGYAGSWKLGMRVTGIRGLASADAVGEYSLGRTHVYPESEYLGTTEATTAELSDRPQGVVERMAAAFTRGLGVADRYFPYDDGPHSFFQRPGSY